MGLYDTETKEWERRGNSNLSRAAQEELSDEQTVMCG